MPLKELGIGGGIGALLGIGLVVWIGPTTNAGIGLVITVSVLVGGVIGAIVERLGRKSGRDPEA